jgi:hypothetical protein
MIGKYNFQNEIAGPPKCDSQCLDSSWMTEEFNMNWSE